MSAEALLDEIIRALESHPDPAFARREAMRVLESALEDPEDCPVCGSEL